MTLDKWKSASLCTKIATVCVVLSAIVGLVLGFVLLDDLEDMFPFFDGSYFVIYLLVYYAIDLAVAVGLLFCFRWARSAAIWWGILAVASIVMARENPSVLFVSYGLSAVAAILLVIARKDFSKKKKGADE